MREIMRVTDTLFHETTFHGISLTTIAERLEWSRGNLYKYVTTKEEIFLELYREKHRAWIEAVAAAFADSTALPPETFAKRGAGVGDTCGFLEISEHSGHHHRNEYSA